MVDVSYMEGTKKCPKCLDYLSFYGVQYNPNMSKGVCYHCPNCDDFYTGTSYKIDDELLAKTVKEAERFKKGKIEEISKTKIDLPKEGDPISFLGDFVALIYEIGDLQYIYECGNDHPLWGYFPGDVDSDEPGGCFVVWGGKLLWELGGEKQSRKHPEKCPKCKEVLVYNDLVKKKNGDMHLSYICNSCGKVYTGLAYKSDPKYLEKAIAYSESFNMKDLERIYNAKIDLPTEDDALVYGGPCHGVVYMSDKEGVEGQQYIHECGQSDSGENDRSLPQWAYYPGKNGGCIIIWGGAMRIDLKGVNPRHKKFPGWLVD